MVTGTAALAGPSDIVDILRYSQGAREIRDLRFAAESEGTRARFQLERAQLQRQRLAKLVGTNAASAFEYVDATLAVIRFRFDVRRADYRVVEAELKEKSLRLQAEWLRRGKEHPKQLALLHVEMRQKRVGIVEDLAAGAKPYADELRFKYDRARQLIAKNAISREEYEAYEIAYRDAADYLVSIEAERLVARDQLKEAETEAHNAPE